MGQAKDRVPAAVVDIGHQKGGERVTVERVK